jgi:hypothetical protein
MIFKFIRLADPDVFRIKLEKTSLKTLANSADFLKSASFVKKEFPAPQVFKRITRYPAAEQ